MRAALMAEEVTEHSTVRRSDVRKAALDDGSASTSCRRQVEAKRGRLSRSFAALIKHDVTR
jgi:hypothetical protein